MMTKIKTIIVDDEFSARKNLEYLTKTYCSSIEIVASVANIEEAVSQIKALKPQLVFLDIEMPKQNGFELFKYFEVVDFHIVFVTAYSQYALKAFEFSAVDYLLKPIDIERLKDAQQRVLKQTRHNENFTILKSNIESKKLKNMAIPYKSDFIVVNLERIICIQADRKYSNIKVFNKEKNIEKVYLYAKKLAFFEEHLPEPNFLRIHRSWIVNINFIKRYSRKDSELILENNQQIPVSKTYKEAFENLFFL